MVKFQITGDAELGRALASLAARGPQALGADALLQAAEPIRQRAASLAPRGSGKPDMADHIIAEARNDPASGQAVVDVGPERRFYASSFTEFGSAHHPARPFLRPAFDSEAERAVAALRRVVWDALR